MNINQENNLNSDKEHLISFPKLNPNPVIELNKLGQVIFANKAAEKSLKESGLKINLDFFIPVDIEDILKKFKNNASQKFFREITVGNNIFLESIHSVPKSETIRIYATDITKRVNAEKALKIINQKLEERVSERTSELTRHNRTISMLSACNIKLVRANKKEKLLKDICNIIVKTGGYKMAWVGEPLSDLKKSVVPIMQVGFEDGYLEKAAVSWSDETLQGRGPTGKSIRERKVQMGRFLSPDPALGPWRKEAIKRNYTSSIALPLLKKDKLLGALSIYSDDSDAFDKKEIELLKELADDLAYGISSIETHQNHAKARKYLIATNRLLKMSNNSNSKKSYLDNVVRYIKEISKCNYIGIRVLNQEGFIPYDATIGFSYKFFQKENKIALDKEQCICTRVVSGRQTSEDKSVTTKFGSFYTGNSLKYISKFGNNCQKKFRGECARCGFASIAVIPIRSKNKIIGAVHIADKKINALSLEKIEFIESLMPIIGEGIEKFNASDGLRENEAKYRELVENANSIILRLDAKGNIVFFNEFAEKFFGYKKEEVIGRSAVGAIIPKTESSGRDLAIMMKDIIKNPGKYGRNENENIKKNGERAWIIWRNKALYDKQGKLEGILSVGNDNTERKIREEQLLESYKHLGTINRKISFLGELSQLTVTHKNRKNVISERMLKPLVNFTGANFGVLFKYDEGKTKTFEKLASVNVQNYAIPDERMLSKNTSQILKLLTRNNTCLREQCDNLSLGKLSSGKKLNYCIVLPLSWENKLKAFIFLGFENEKDFSNQDMEFLNVFAAYSSSLLVNTKVFK